MKTFLLFVSGILTAGLLIVIGAFFFWKNSPTNSSPLSNVPKAVSTLNDPKDQIVVSGTVIMPPAVRIYKPGQGRFLLYLKYGASFEKTLSIEYAQSGVNFPRAIRAIISRKALSEAVKESQGNFILLGYYAPAKTGLTGRSFLYAEPTAVLFQPLRTPPDPNANSIDLGSLAFSAVATQAFYEKCVGDKVLLQGKVLPPPNFEKKFAGKKLALVVYPDSPDISWLPANTGAAEFDRLVLHTQFLDFANGPVSFSLPWKKTPSSLLRIIVSVCEPNADLKSCSLQAFPGANAAKNYPRTFGLANKNLERPVCGDTDYTAIFPSSVTN